jgi:low temperature requirement protein LtrA
VIVVLGDSILLTGATFVDLDSSAVTVTAFVVAFAGSVALWWIYFDRGARLASDVIAVAANPGRLGRSA